MQSATGFVAGSLPSGEIGFRLTYARQFRHGQATGERGAAHCSVHHRCDQASGRANSAVAQGGRHRAIQLARMVLQRLGQGLRFGGFG
jgi:hypothetical protein